VSQDETEKYDEEFEYVASEFCLDQRDSPECVKGLMSSMTKETNPPTPIQRILSDYRDAAGPPFYVQTTVTPTTIFSAMFQTKMKPVVFASTPTKEMPRGLHARTRYGLCAYLKKSTA
jgi:hypothetical protein